MGNAWQSFQAILNRLAKIFHWMLTHARLDTFIFFQVHIGKSTKYFLTVLQFFILQKFHIK